MGMRGHGTEAAEAAEAAAAEVRAWKRGRTAVERARAEGEERLERAAWGRRCGKRVGKACTWRP
jgi:hypothetical protein